MFKHGVQFQKAIHLSTKKKHSEECFSKYDSVNYGNNLISA